MKVDRGFIVAVIKALPDIIDPLVARMWINDPGGLTQALGRALAPEARSYPCFVDYEGSIMDSARRGNYDAVNWSELKKAPRTEMRGRRMLCIELLPHKPFDDSGYRPVELLELLEFGAKYPDVQLIFSIFGKDNGELCPCLGGTYDYSCHDQQRSVTFSIPNRKRGGL